MMGPGTSSYNSVLCSVCVNISREGLLEVFFFSPTTTLTRLAQLSFAEHSNEVSCDENASRSLKNF